MSLPLNIIVIGIILLAILFVYSDRETLARQNTLKYSFIGPAILLSAILFNIVSGHIIPSSNLLSLKDYPFHLIINNPPTYVYLQLIVYAILDILLWVWLFRYYGILLILALLKPIITNKNGQYRFNFSVNSYPQNTKWILVFLILLTIIKYGITIGIVMRLTF